jgi:hypothetical protein
MLPDHQILFDNGSFRVEQLLDGNRRLRFNEEFTFELADLLALVNFLLSEERFALRAMIKRPRDS